MEKLRVSQTNLLDFIDTDQRFVFFEVPNAREREIDFQLYPRKCFLMFYNFFPKAVICYALSVYGTAATTHLKKKSKLLREKF